jgi:hypothetical protein
MSTISEHCIVQRVHDLGDEVRQNVTEAEGKFLELRTLIEAVHPLLSDDQIEEFDDAFAALDDALESVDNVGVDVQDHAYQAATIADDALESKEKESYDDAKEKISEAVVDAIPDLLDNAFQIAQGRQQTGFLPEAQVQDPIAYAIARREFCERCDAQSIADTVDPDYLNFDD